MTGISRLQAWRRSTIASRARRSDRGVAALEFALVVPLLVLLMCGIIDFSMAIQARTSLSSAARAGARVASFGGSEAMIRDAVTKSMGTTGVAITIQCRTATGSVCVPGAVANVGGLITVDVSERYNGVTHVFAQLIDMPISGTSVMVIEQ